MKKGDKIAITEKLFKVKGKTKLVCGTFIKDYGSYIQLYDKYNIRRSIMKHDILEINHIG